MNFDRILFPVDLSDESRRVAPFVKAVALRFHSEILMLHVVQFFPSWYGPTPEIALVVADQLDELRKQRRAELETFLREDFSSLSVIRELAEGDPAQQIVNFATSQRINLIMMATHGYGPFRAVLLGSVTAKVLHDAECPVWTAVHVAELMPHAPERWRRVLCAVDVTQNDARVVRCAAELARAEAADLCVLHAITKVDPESTWPDDSSRKLLVESARNHLATMLEKNARGLERAVSVEFGSPAKAVRKVATDWEADLVVIGRGLGQKGLGRLRSNAYAIIRESPCPVISV